MSITENLKKIQSTLPEGVTLVAVSKYHPAEMVREAYDAGQRVFGESRESELKEKDQVLPHDIAWHFIGHLQTNKVKYIAPIVTLIHSIDTERLLDEVQRQAIRWAEVRRERFGTDSIDVLLQLHVAQEETKSGFTPDELLSLLNSVNIAQRWPNVRLRGVMAMATYTDDEIVIRNEFHRVKECYEALLAGPLAAQGISREQFCIKSYGMSDDYPIAISEGSNMVRVGTAIFGARKY